MTLLHTPTRFNPRLLARNPLLAKSLQLSTPPFARRSFAAFAPLQQPQPSPPARSEDNGHHSYQPHFKDGKDAPVSTSWSSSRPHEAWTMVTTVYTPEDVEAVKVVRLERKTITDKLAYGMVKFARWGFDLVTGYKHASPEEALEALKKAGKTDLSLEVLRKEGYIMTEQQWLHRILFLESIAGVPGFTAGILRHLRSLRRMQRDNGWINSLLQEAENERMHLMTFMKIKEPSMFFRLMVLGAQGVFFNAFFFTYLISPRAAHRFVGFLEEEAVVTYTQIIDEMKRGHLPEWDKGAREVPQIAKDYWRMPDSATMMDLILAVRADESNHRCVNHTLAALKPTDVNPFGSKHATPEMAGTMPGLTRVESLAWTQRVEEEVRAGMKKGLEMEAKAEQEEAKK